MKEKIFAKLKEKIGKTGLSDRTVMSKAERMAKKITTDELFTDEVLQDAVDDLKELDGQLNHDVAEKVKEAIKAQEPKPKPKEGEGNGNGGGGKDDDELGKTVKELLEFKTKFESSQAEKQQKEEREKFLSSVSDQLKANGASDDFYREHVLLKNGVDTEKSVEDNVKTLRSAYDQLVKERVTDTARPWGGGEPAKPVTADARQAAIKADLEKEKDKWKV